VTVKLEELEVGQSAEFTKTVSSEDVERFAEITGDFNPVHLDEAVAEKSFFGGRVAHGMLTAGLISATLAGKLPGPGTVYLSQTLRFTAPVRIGDTVTTRVEVTELIPAKRRVKLSTVCRNQKNEVVVNGEAMVLLPESAEYDVFEITGAQVK
jgi:3-hydroxybutyryl-CoA dehydratase